MPLVHDGPLSPHPGRGTAPDPVGPDAAGSARVAA